MPWQWIAEGAEDARVHTIPVGDDIVHLEGKHCPCEPEEEFLPAIHPDYKLAVRSRLIHHWIGEEPDVGSTS